MKNFWKMINIIFCWHTWTEELQCLIVRFDSFFKKLSWLKRYIKITTNYHKGYTKYCQTTKLCCEVNESQSRAESKFRFYFIKWYFYKTHIWQCLALNDIILLHIWKFKDKKVKKSFFYFYSDDVWKSRCFTN